MTIDRYEAHRGQRTTVLTLDQGAVTGTLGAMSTNLEGEPLSIEIRDPDELRVPWVLIPWTSVAGIHPEDVPVDTSTHPAGALTTDAD